MRWWDINAFRAETLYLWSIATFTRSEKEENNHLSQRNWIWLKSYLQYVPNLCEVQSMSKKLRVKAWLRVQCDNAKWRCLFTFCLWISSCRFCCCFTVGKQVDEERWMWFPRVDYSSARQLGSVLLWVLFFFLVLSNLVWEPIFWNLDNTSFHSCALRNIWTLGSNLPSTSQQQWLLP